MSDVGSPGSNNPGSSPSRRTLLRGMAGIAGLSVAGGLLSACDSSSSTPSDSGSAGGQVTFGSNYSDPAAKTAFAALAGAATKASGSPIKINTVDHNTFQTNITSYLQGTPDDLFTWFAGYRMQYFAAQGLALPIDDVWEKIGGNFGPAAKKLSTGLDGHQYLVPMYNYPWVVFYNKSVFSAKGYTVPTNWDQYLALAKKMKTDGMIPIAFADKDGWPALGTFDILNMRINGYDYHMKLMKHEIPWTDPGVTQVFDHWAQLMPYVQSGANGRIWQDAAKALETKQAGMMFQGTNQVAAQYVTDKANLDDLDFFVFPEINPAYGTDYMDAPTDGFMLSKKAKNTVAAKKILEYIGTGAAEAEFLKTDQWDVGLATGLKVPSYNAIQTKSVAEIAKCKAVAQYMDRDADPAMSNAMISIIQKFIADPSSGNIASLQKSAESQAKAIYTS
ncbi:extracellular solute-binding protein [Streptomyces sp. SID13666]|uniref:ABC transporter substrate-binding protein n=2 Tax=Streptomyces TaxID=1883 RepID=UPI001105A0F1|nr:MULTISPECIES: extracellular solute-binding protein [unclassified Streptomyces]NEA57397.1 extracellular solute-binding protein [Streptomyces sp. SID13666]NEA75203.1 extracellular solute-binding protein [Streptomyces sp. SID13588]QNA71696.1 extracellular solute-binding protein [Streptomyces sp. So13.3]